MPQPDSSCPVACAESAFDETMAETGSTRAAVVAAIQAYQFAEATLQEADTSAAVEDIQVPTLEDAEALWSCLSVIRTVMATEHDISSAMFATICLEEAVSVLAETTAPHLIAAHLRDIILRVHAGEFDPSDIANMQPPSAARN
ncbi:hypothetical protein [Azospirillum argentinense]|uniref:Uncharacterized protein n=1 Tax=Azospirillum brasilense TaxID=192 RepID=A0A4D8QEC5_AZOBR|nr:hypothetical protein [Azospirillum argentinense]QCO07286.1 hypothetical protein D3867_36000 [Azospirillum argentinense]